MARPQPDSGVFGVNFRVAACVPCMTSSGKRLSTIADPDRSRIQAPKCRTNRTESDGHMRSNIVEPQ